MKSSSETKKDTFRRVAKARTNAVLEKLRLIGNLANSRIYDYDEEDVDKMFSVIKRRIKEIRGKFVKVTDQEFEF